MKKFFVMLTAIIGFGISAEAQTWQGSVAYNGYHVHSLGSLVNHKVLAMLDSYQNTNPALIHIKFKIPYRYSGGTAVATNDGTTVHLHYSDGWAYFDYYCSGQCPNFIFTVYESNDPHDSSRGKVDINTHLDKLNLSHLSKNSKTHTTYW